MRPNPAARGWTPWANRIEKASDAGFARLLDSEIAALGKVRRSAVDDKLYTTGKALDFLTNAKILLARRAKKAEKAPMTLDEMRKAVAASGRRSMTGPATTG